MVFRQMLTLFPDTAEIHVDNEIDWKGPRWVRMQQLFPYAGTGREIRYGAPYGQVTFPDRMSGALGKLGDEIAPEYRDKLRLCRHWVDIGNDSSGITIGCDHRMWEFGGAELRSYMIRGNGYCFAVKRNPDGSLENFHRPPEATYTFRYIIRPRAESLADSASYRCGWELNRPLLGSAVCGTNGKPTLPGSGGLFDFHGGNSGQKGGGERRHSDPGIRSRRKGNNLPGPRYQREDRSGNRYPRGATQARGGMPPVRDQNFHYSQWQSRHPTRQTPGQEPGRRTRTSY